MSTLKFNNGAALSAIEGTQEGLKYSLVHTDTMTVTVPAEISQEDFRMAIQRVSERELVGYLTQGVKFSSNALDELAKLLPDGQVKDLLSSVLFDLPFADEYVFVQ